MLDLQHVLALGVFGSYFLIILGLFGLIFSSLWEANASLKSRKRVVEKPLFVVLTLASFAHTWFYMFKYMAWSFSNYEKSLLTVDDSSLVRISSWLLDTSLFEEAWATVCRGPLNWWWSEQLCLFTVGAWTVFLATEGHKKSVKHLWAYMVLGQLVAISVASNLFYLALIISPVSSSTRSPTFASPKLWISVLISLGTIALSPLTSDRTFLPNLLVMHALLVVPLIASSSVSISKQPSSWKLRITTLYSFIALAAVLIRFFTLMRTSAALQEVEDYSLISFAWTTLHSHPAQSSIGWDIVWTSISFIIWTIATSWSSLSFTDCTYLLFGTPFASIGVSAPAILRSHEVKADAVENSKEE